MTAHDQPMMEARGIHKGFGAVVALRGVDFDVRAGEVHALLGDNGAGKSTLIQILDGVFRPDRGELRWEGRSVRLDSPRDAMALGISVVFQDLAVVDTISIYRNFFLGRERAISRKLGPLLVLNPSLAKRKAYQALQDVGISVRSVDEPVGSLSGGERQSIAIARAVYFQSKLLILDEPMSALSVRETEKVLQYIIRARDRGLGVCVISHNIASIYPITDRFTVLAHGQSLGSFGREEVDIEELASMIR
jgi:simple sugar transport system ATP-binding protein